MECSEFTHIRSDKVIYMRSKRDKVEKIDKTENQEQQVDMESIKKQKIQLSILTKLGWASLAANFAKKIDGTLKNYYKGNTSDGRYNDNTGNAYLVCYDDQGYVLSLYIGQFKNGKYDDMSGNAIEVVFDSSNNINRYFFYKGKFKNGGRVNDENIEYVSIEQLQVLLKNIEFECSLDWME